MSEAFINIRHIYLPTTGQQPLGRPHNYNKENSYTTRFTQLQVAPGRCQYL